MGITGRANRERRVSTPCGRSPALLDDLVGAAPSLPAAASSLPARNHLRERRLNLAGEVRRHYPMAGGRSCRKGFGKRAMALAMARNS